MYEFGAAEREAAAQVLASGRLFRYMEDAHEAERFEAELATTLSATHALATSSGTAALICALAAHGVGPGDEVLIPAYGYVADVLAVLAVGAVPVVCEIDEALTLDPVDAARRVTAQTRAIMPVHMNGMASDLDPIVALAESHGLVVVEDACQAIGGTYKGRRLGTIGDAGAFSFNQAKIITAGEGGALVTNDRACHERAFITHDASSVFDGLHFDSPVFAGLAFRMNEVSAAILRVQLTRLDGILERLRGIRRRLAEALEPLASLRRIPEHDADGSCGSHLGYALPDPEAAGLFRRALEAEHVYTMAPNSLGHSFFDWNLLHERRGGHHPLRNPLADRPDVQGIDDLPVSLDIMNRTVLVGYQLDLNEQAIDGVHRALSKEFG